MRRRSAASFVYRLLGRLLRGLVRGLGGGLQGFLGLLFRRGFLFNLGSNGVGVHDVCRRGLLEYHARIAARGCQ
jgi:hypothetical protein